MSEEQGQPARSEPGEELPVAAQAALPGLEEETPATLADAAEPVEAVGASAPDDEPAQPEPVTEAASELAERLAAVEEALETVSDHLRVVPQSLRMLTGKVAELTTSVSEARVRSLLLALAAFYDLLDQPLRRAADPGQLDERYRDFPLLRTQLLQLFGDEGLELVDSLGPFDPACHRAIERVPTADPTLDGHVAELVRPGFRSQAAVLRYAEVLVYGYQPPEPAAEPPADTADEVG